MPPRDRAILLGQWLPALPDPGNSEAAAAWRSDAGLDLWLAMVELSALEKVSKAVKRRLTSLGVHVFRLSRSSPPAWLHALS